MTIMIIHEHLPSNKIHVINFKLYLKKLFIIRVATNKFSGENNINLMFYFQKLYN